MNFYPRPPRGGRPVCFDDVAILQDISIHALREEGDDGHSGADSTISQFLSTPSARRATVYQASDTSALSKFLSTPSARRATFGYAASLSLSARFLSTPSARRATLLRSPVLSGNHHFYPRPPRGGRHIVCRKSSGHLLFLSTPSARRATYRLQKEQRTPPISIHALREEGDRERLQRSHRDHQISIHALREEGDRAAPAGSWPAIAFLSTPSARRATIRFRPVSTTHCNFYPRPPRGGRPIRPPAPCCPGRYFYPRPPRGGRQKAKIMAASILEISIHALREEGDGGFLFLCGQKIFYFYPRPPRGGRLPGTRQIVHDAEISIHALREEGDISTGTTPRTA